MEKPFSISNLVALTAKSEKKAFQRQRKLGFNRLLSTSVTLSLPGE